MIMKVNPEVDKCTVCLQPILYGSRHHSCGDAIIRNRKEVIHGCIETVENTIQVEGETVEQYRDAVLGRLSNMLKGTFIYGK